MGLGDNDHPAGQWRGGIYESNIARLPCGMCGVKQSRMDSPTIGMAAAMRTPEDMEARRAKARPLRTKTARKDLLKKVSGVVNLYGTLHGVWSCTFNFTVHGNLHGTSHETCDGKLEGSVH